jgi:hypothetical protein
MLQHEALTIWQWRRLLALLAFWANGPMDVVVSADVQDCSGWLEEWADALGEAQKIASMTFHLRSDHRRGGHREN